MSESTNSFEWILKNIAFLFKGSNCSILENITNDHKSYVSAQFDTEPIGNWSTIFEVMVANKGLLFAGLARLWFQQLDKPLRWLHSYVK